jgi:hypothetical protein
MRAFVLVLASLGFLPSALGAQAASLDSLTLAHIRKSIRGNRRIQIATNEKPLEVEQWHLNADGIVVRAGADTEAILWRAVSVIQVHRSAAVPVMEGGAVLGAALGLLVGVSEARSPCGERFFPGCNESGAGAAVPVVLAGTFVGGILGLVVGAPFTYWAPVYDGRGRWLPLVGLAPARGGGVAVSAGVRF